MSGRQVITLGCRLNIAESETMRRAAAGQDDLVIVNSCAVTAQAVKQTRQAIRRAKRARPQARVLVTGCAAEIDPAMFEAMPEVDGVVSNSRKLVPLSFVPSEVEGRIGTAPQRPSTSVPSAEVYPERLPWKAVEGLGTSGVGKPVSHSDRSRAFVAVQNGCDHRCTFCIIPYGRGPSRSVPAGPVIERIQALVDGGCREVVLTGVDVTSYGPDLPGAPTLGRLVERILRHVPALPRLRLSSLDSVEIDERLHDIITGEPRFMPHLHLSFQAGDDMILKRMKRRHSRAQAIETVQRIKAARPDVSIGADLIAGFPTETDDMHENSLALIEECDIVHAHIFPYSPRPGTPAARMPQVEPAIVKARAKRLREAAARRRSAWLQSLVGTTQNVLWERGRLGHTEAFAPVRLSRTDPSCSHPRESGDPASSWANERGQRDSRFRETDEKGVTTVKIAELIDDALIGTPA